MQHLLNLCTLLLQVLCATHHPQLEAECAREIERQEQVVAGRLHEEREEAAREAAADIRREMEAVSWGVQLQVQLVAKPACAA